MQMKWRHFLPKLLGILLVAVLIACCIAPFQRARENTQQEYIDVYRYSLRSQEYFRAYHSAISNLSDLATEIKVQDPFLVFSTSDALLEADEILNSKLNYTYATLATIPDPGDVRLVSTINRSFDAYNKVRNLIFSADYDDKNFDEDLADALTEARDCDRDLSELINK